MQLIIAEKPDQGAKLAAPFKHKKTQGYIEIAKCPTFPDGAYVSWAVGHICELVPPEEYDPAYKRWSLDSLPILPGKFKHRITPSKAKQFNLLKDLLKRPEVGEIIIASDAGREGEYIVRIIIQLSGVKKPMKRLWISSLTPRAVEQGFANLKDESETRNLYYEAVSRSCADWLVGMNGSRVYSLLFQRRGIRDVFSTGRVQSPTLALIVSREKEIANFKPEPFWEVKARFDINGAEYEGTWFKGEETRLKTPEEAEEIRARCEGKNAVVDSIETERKEFQPPQLFSLSSLQASANQIYKYSPQDTLSGLQQLYLDGYISYPRSDSSYVTDEEAKQFPDILKKLENFDALKPFLPAPKSTLIGNKRYVNASKVGDHYAIVPTEQVPAPGRLQGMHLNLYLLIAKRLIAAHEEKAVIDYTTLVTLVDGRDPFQTKGKVIVQEGWRKVLYDSAPKKKAKNANAKDEDKNDKDDEEDDLSVLPPVQKGDEGKVADVQVKEGKTQPPKRYTEGQLITLMKTAGKHLDNAELEKVLQRTEGLGTEATRANIIGGLKDRKYIDVRKNMVYATNKGTVLIEALGESVLASAEMTAKWEQRLGEIGQGQESPKTFMEQAQRLAEKIVSDAVAGEKGWAFSVEPPSGEDRPSAGNRPGNRAAGSRNAAAGSDNKGGAPSAGIGACPICGKPVVDKKNFYGCTGYPACSFTISKKILGKALSETQVKRLLDKGRTLTLKGFKKGEKTFDAALSWNPEQRKLDFIFPDREDKAKPGAVQAGRES
ncbi:DNA topoisomerase III [Saccharibacillus sp. CPCC 101409]|uniref:DNA topoisomerase III n=1 Tax=Saccharibacillus sp. CPCC 101409 TaxID=3058041 RepID=UPI002670ED31|nr:DNA topoisomerase III [Saccharibacillus sp. CPCC 101409]MDO3412862.1 DNA topoisomerase III [Saccharibacillus sp. CPCC 101409]